MYHDIFWCFEIFSRQPMWLRRVLCMPLRRSDQDCRHSGQIFNKDAIGFCDERVIERQEQYLNSIAPTEIWIWIPNKILGIRCALPECSKDSRTVSYADLALTFAELKEIVVNFELLPRQGKCPPGICAREEKQHYRLPFQFFSCPYCKFLFKRLISKIYGFREKTSSVNCWSRPIAQLSTFCKTVSLLCVN